MADPQQSVLDQAMGSTGSEPQATQGQAAGGSVLDQAMQDTAKTAQEHTAVVAPVSTPYNWLERTEAATVGRLLPEDNKVLNWVNEHVAQPPVRMGKETGNILTQRALGKLGEEMHLSDADQVPDWAKGNETAYWRMRAEQEAPGLSGITESVMGTIGDLAGNPTNWPLMGAAAAKSAVLKTFTKVFGYQMAKDAISEGANLWDNWDKMSREEKFKGVTDLVTHSFFAKQALKGHGTGETETPKAAKPSKVAGELPVTQTHGGVEVPISAQHAESVAQGNSPRSNQPIEATKTGAHEIKEFQRQQTAPAATAAAHSILGQSAEDMINQHDAVLNGQPMPDSVADAGKPSKYQTIDDAANALNTKARETTYAKADEISQREQAEWQRKVEIAHQNEQAGIDHYNEMVDEHNANLQPGEEPMEHETFDPSKVNVPERPKTYGELKGAVDRAYADLKSPDASVREEAVDNIEKAEKQLDNWFKQHSDEISPEEYTSAKKLVYAGARFQEIANSLRSSIDNDNLTGNKLRSVISAIDSRMIKRGEPAGAFERLVGKDVYDNWRKVSRLFDPIQEAPRGLKSLGHLAMHFAVHHFLGPLGLVGKVGAHWLLDRVLSTPAWGEWFGDLSQAIKDKVSSAAEIPQNLLDRFKSLWDGLKNREEGAVGAKITPRAAGSPVPPKFGRVGLGGKSVLEEAMKPGPSGFPEATVEEKSVPEREQTVPTTQTPTANVPVQEPIADRPESEIGTRYPRSANATGENNPDEMPNMEAMDKAEASSPGYFRKLVDAMRGYEAAHGLPIEDETGTPRQIVNRVIDHLADNLVWLHNNTPESIRNISKQWYDTAHKMTKDLAAKYGVSHEKMAAVTAALSPKNGWDNNVGMADRLVDHWKNARQHPWDGEMEKKLNEITGRDIKPAFRKVLNTLRGKTYDQLTADSPEALLAKKGLWIRLYDEAHRSKQTPIYAPDGSIRGHQTLTWGMPDPMAKALAILEGPDTVQHINSLMGEKNKIRSFYNNIINPNSPRGHVTIDTHAVGADMLKPMSSEDEEVLHNFGGAPGHAETGLSGTYPMHAEAYRRAAAKLGILPRELQSITWEAIRTLFTDTKKSNPETRRLVNELWQKYKGKEGVQSQGGDFEARPVKKSLTLDQVRDEIVKAVGGFDRPVWNPDTSQPMNQMATLQGPQHSITSDFETQVPADVKAKWQGKPRPEFQRTANGRVRASSIDDLADHMNANVTPEEALHTAAHETAHALLQHELGTPTDNASMELGHSAIVPGRKDRIGKKFTQAGISGGGWAPGDGWQKRFDDVATIPDRKEMGQKVASLLHDYVTQLMGGRAIEELLGTKPEDVDKHVSNDERMARKAMSHYGVHPALHNTLMREATTRAKAILHDKWDTVQHTAAQLAHHFGGGTVDSATFHRYRQGETYKK